MSQSEERSVGSPKASLIFGYVAVTLLGLLTLFQGGYYSDTACAFGIITFVLALISFCVFRRMHRPLVLSVAPIVLAAIGIFVWISAYINDASIDSFAEAGSWFATALFALLCDQIASRDRHRVYCVLGWVGVATAVLALLMCGGVFPYEGSVSAGRLQYSFQYANTAALWFTVIFFVASLSDDKSLRICAFFPCFALVITQSMSMLLLFGIAFLCMIAVLYRRRQLGRITALVLQMVCVCASVLLVIEVGLSNVPWLAIVLSLGGFALLVLLRRIIGPPLERFFIANTRKTAFILFGAIAIMGTGLLVAFFVSGRLGQAAQTLIERFVQTSDAIALLSRSPIIGVSPEGWIWNYQDIQAAQYVAQTVHNGYIYVALMSGCIGLLLFVAFLVLGIRGAYRKKDAVALFALALICFHSLFDFDLAYMSILAMLVFFLQAPSIHRFGEKMNPVCALAVVALSLSGCVVGLGAWQQKSEVVTLLEEDNIPEAEVILDSNSLLGTSESVTTAYLTAICRESQTDRAEKLYWSLEHPSLDQVIVISQALSARGEDQDAETILLDKMDAQPRNVRLFEYAEIFFNEHDLSVEGLLRFESIRERANTPYSGIASLLGNQKLF